MTKNLVKSVLDRLGYRISRIDTPPQHRNAYRDLQYLLRNEDNPVIFDVGAYRGEVARDFRRLFPKGRIHAFEPNQKAFTFLRENMSSDPNCQVHCCGLADTRGKAEFHINKDAATSSLASLEKTSNVKERWSWNGLEPADIIEVDLETVDNILESLSIRQIDLLKMDVQGAESRVLAGAARAIEESRINVIYTEVLVEPAYVGQHSIGDLLKTFSDYGFEIFNMYNFMSTSAGKLLQFDAIFCKIMEKTLYA
jgi:FkbM family methyltransferase